MGVVKNLMVRIGADFSSIPKEANKAQKSMGKMQANVSKSCSRMSSAVSGMNRACRLIGVTLSAAAITAFAKSAKEAYETQIQGETKLATVMRQRMGASDAEIKKIYELTAAQQRLGIIGDEIQLSGAQQLATFLKETNSLNVLVPAMNNLVAQQKGFNATTKDAYTVANMMGKAMQGQYTALRRVGITFTDAEAAVLQYGNEAERAAMLAQIITNNVGPMNQALASTPSGRLKQVSNVLGDIKEQTGGAVTSLLTVFLPALNTLCNILAKAAALANRVSQAIANVFGGKSTAAASTVSYSAAAADSMEDLAGATEAAGKAGSAAKKSLGSFGFDTLQKLSTSGSGSSGGSGGSSDSVGSAGGIFGGDLLPGSDEAGESVGWLEKALTKLKKTVNDLNFEPLKNSFDNLKNAATPLGDAISNGLGWAYDNVLVPIASWTISEALPSFLNVAASAADVLSSALDALKPLGNWLWESFLQPIGQWAGSVIISALEKLADRLKGVSNWISKHQTAVQNIAIVIGSFAAAWGLVNAAVGIWNGIAVAASVVTTAFGAAVNFLTSPVTLVIAAIGALIAIVVLLVKNWDTVKEAAANAWEAVKRIWKTASKWFTDTVIDPIVRNFKRFANGIIGYYEGIANLGIRAVNKLIQAINRISFDVPNWVPVIGGKKWGFNIKEKAEISLPRLADGQVFRGNDPYLAIVNDQKRGINVESPLSVMVDAFNTSLRQNGGAAGQVEVVNHVSFEGSLSALARTLAPAIVAEIRRVGASASHPMKGVV